MPTELWANIVFSLVPTIVLGLIFWLVIRSILRSDRSERKVQARIETEERRKAGLPEAKERATADLAPKA